MPSPAVLRATDARAAGRAARRFLLEQQGDDGLWTDYELPPGPSDAWTTSFVGIALARTEAPCAPLDRARAAVAQRRREAGWGYNSTTACDADTTSFALRFAGGEASVLGRYLDRHGNAHTFREQRFGSWAWAHPDVTATVGLAAAACGAPAALLARIRTAVLGSRTPAGTWHSFWWATDAYALARSLELLAATGGVPPAVAAAAGAAAHERTTGSAFEAAQLLTAATLAGAATGHLTARLLDLQEPDGGWPPSAELLVPDQLDGSSGTAHEDGNRFHSTAAALEALGRITGSLSAA